MKLNNDSYDKESNNIYVDEYVEEGIVLATPIPTALFDTTHKT